MSSKFVRKGALFMALCFVLLVCLTPSGRGWLTSAYYDIVGREVRYFNNELQNDGIDTNNYNFGYDRKAAADAAVKAGTVGSDVDWVAKRDGTGDFFYSISVDPALCAAIALHMDNTLVYDEPILKDEQSVIIGRRADEAHLHFLRDFDYWDRAIRLIKERLTSGSISVEYIKKSPTSMMYMHYNALEGNKPSVIVRNTVSTKGYVVVFNLGKPGTVRFRLNCGYQPIDLGYWPAPVPPGPDPEPEPTPELDPKDPDAGPQAQMEQHPQPGYEDFGGGPNHDPDTTLTEEPESPAAYKPPARPTNPPATNPPATNPPATNPPSVVTGPPPEKPLDQVQEEEHSSETIEQPLQGDGLNEGDLDEGAVE